jgi:hypothetical protein
MYLSSCGCSFIWSRCRKLFPGSSQSQSDRASAILKKVLKEKKQEVLSMGYDSITNIGLNSIWKGVSTYLASLPGGPSPAALCPRGGWSMGQVKDIYFHHTQGGDEFTGRCSTLLNMMNGEFASSPAFFDDSVLDANWMTGTLGKVFPNFQSVGGMDRILCISLASLIHHQEKVMAFDANHIARSIPIFRDLSTIETVFDKIKVVRALDSRLHVVTGVPPHIKELVDLEALRKEHSQLSNKVYEKVINGLQEYFEVR